MGSPQPDQTLWLLVGTSTVKRLQRIDLATGKVLRTIAVNGSATSVAESRAGTVAVGYNDPSGTVELRNGASGALNRSVTVGQPVKAITVQGTTPTFYVLDGTATATTVNALSTAGRSVGPAIGVPLDSVAIAVDPAASQLYLLETSNQVTDIPLTEGGAPEVASNFFVGKGAVRIALDDGGSSLFVLKSVGGGCNIGVADVGTESVVRVVPAPVDCVAIANGPDRRVVYVLVNTSTVGNIQTIGIG